MHSFLKSIIGILLLVTYTTSCGCVTLFEGSNTNSFKNAPRESFVKISVATPEGIATGSGVIINHIDNSNTIVLTAGHICKNNTIEMKVLDFYENPFFMIGMINSKEDDLCVVIVNGIINGKALRAGTSQPELGEYVLNIAAPAGVHGPILSLVFDGYYQGDMVFEEEKHKLSVFSIPGMGGSSGSPILNNDYEIIGIVSRGLVRFNHLMLCVSQSRVKMMIEKTYTTEFRIEMINAMKTYQISLLDFVNKLIQANIQ